MSERTLSVVTRIKTPADLLVEVLSSWDVDTETVDQSRRGGRPKRRR